MLKFLKSLLKVKTAKVVTLKYSSRQVDLVRRALAEGFKAVWNGAVWVLTKVVYV